MTTRRSSFTGTAAAASDSLLLRLHSLERMMCAAEIRRVLAEGAEEPEWPAGEGDDHRQQPRTGHSSTRGACSTAFSRQSPRRPQRATGTRTLSLTGLATCPPGERVTLSLEDGGPSIEAGGLTPLEARLDQSSARCGASWTQTSCIFSSSPDCLLPCLWVSASSLSSCPSAYGLS